MKGKGKSFMKKSIIARTFCLLLAVLMVSMLVLPASATGGSVEKDGVVEVMDASSLLKGNLVFYPKELESTEHKVWPVVVWANGTMCAPVLYENLLRSIAKAGFVVVASSEVMSADGKDQCKSIDYILGKNADQKSVFFGKIDADRIAAAGHSQGGRSSVNAAVLDGRIKCIVSIAGSSYTSEAKKLNTPALFIGGGADLVVPTGIWVKPAYNSVKGPAAYAVLKGAVHTTCCIAPKEISGYAVHWLNMWLCGESTAAKVFTKNGTMAKDKDWKDFTCKGL